jgi:adenylate cyclase
MHPVADGDDPGAEQAEPEAEPPARRGSKTGERLRRLDSKARLITAARALRRHLPGDPDLGDPLSIAGNEPPQLIGQRLSALSSERPSALREVGLSALQIWQAASEAQGRGQGDHDVAILFTDLVDFSDWTLEAGDTQALDLLRRVGGAIEPSIAARGGQVVKRLGDGLMAVFDDAGDAVEAALEASAAVAGISIGGHRPAMRAGVHVGRPRKLGGDYYGVDVNVAARVVAAASGGEVLVSQATCRHLDAERLKVGGKVRFKAKGTPDDLEVFRVALEG